MRKIFTENLPKKTNKEKESINWKNSVGYKVHFIYDDIEDDIEILNYGITNNIYKISIKYKENICSINVDNFKKCQLARILNKHTKDFKVEIGQVFKDDKRDFIIIDREYRKDNGGINRKWYKYHCNKCGAELWKEESRLLRRQGCSCCNGKTVVEGINDISTTNPELVKYFVNIDDAYKYSNGNGNKILIKCPYCGFQKEIRICTLVRHGFSCPRCGDGVSYPNKLMFNLLEQLNVEFINEYSPYWIKPKRYDFYIPSKNLIIEMDGGFHNSDNDMSGQTAEQSKEIDNYKDKLAEEHDLKVIRIDCDYKHKNKFNYIMNNIINSKLNKIFDLKNINWNKVVQYTEKNLVKEVCDYWCLHNDINNEELTTTDLAKIFNINNENIRNYLKQGTKLGWCNYNTKIGKTYSNYKVAKSREKNIEVFTKYNEISLGIFSSGKYLECNSIKLFGVKFDASQISAVCNGKRKTHKGYTFKYVK